MMTMMSEKISKPIAREEAGSRWLSKRVLPCKARTPRSKKGTARRAYLEHNAPNDFSGAKTLMKSDRGGLRWRGALKTRGVFRLLQVVVGKDSSLRNRSI